MEYLQYTRADDSHAPPVFRVLNLVINGIPSILITLLVAGYCYGVLNLVINGIPSILRN